MPDNHITQRTPLRSDRETHHHEAVKYWSTLPISEERAKELVDLLTNHGSDHVTDALIELICGLTPDERDSNKAMGERYCAGLAALLHAFTYTTRAQNEAGAYVVHLKVAKWDE